MTKQACEAWLLAHDLAWVLTCFPLTCQPPVQHLTTVAPWVSPCVAKYKTCFGNRRIVTALCHLKECLHWTEVGGYESNSLQWSCSFSLSVWRYLIYYANDSGKPWHWWRSETAVNLGDKRNKEVFRARWNGSQAPSYFSSHFYHLHISLFCQERSNWHGQSRQGILSSQPMISLESKPTLQEGDEQVHVLRLQESSSTQEQKSQWWRPLLQRWGLSFIPLQSLDKKHFEASIMWTILHILTDWVTFWYSLANGRLDDY